MRAAAIVLSLALAGGATYAAYAATAPSPAARDPSAPVGESAPDALLPRAREEARAYGSGWVLMGLNALEAASTEGMGDYPLIPDPRPGNGLAPVWYFRFTGPDGMAFAAIKANGQRAAVGWTEWVPRDPAPPLPAWKVGSDEAVRLARAEPEVARFLDQDGIQLHVALGMMEQEGSFEPWWQFHGWRRGAEGPDGGASPGSGVAFAVHALDGRVQVHPLGQGAEPPAHVPGPGEATHGASASGTLHPTYDRMLVPLQGPAQALAARAELRLAYRGELPAPAGLPQLGGVPAQLVLRLLDGELRALAERAGPSPIALAAADLPPGTLYAEVAFADGQPPTSATFEFEGLLFAAMPPDPRFEEPLYLHGTAGTLVPSATPPFAVPEGGVVRADAIVEPYPPGQHRVRLLDDAGNVVAERTGARVLRLEAGPLPAGDYRVDVLAVGPAEPVPGMGGQPFSVQGSVLWG